MGNYRDALAEMPVDPDITPTRAYRIKYGFGVSFEQETDDGPGLVRCGPAGTTARSEAGRSPRSTRRRRRAVAEGHGVAPAERRGRPGGRGQRPVGRPPDYLAAGGLGFIIGDGALSYAPEEIARNLLQLGAAKGIDVTSDFQGVEHPAVQPGPRSGRHRRSAGAFRVLTADPLKTTASYPRHLCNGSPRTKRPTLSSSTARCRSAMRGE